MSDSNVGLHVGRLRPMPATVSPNTDCVWDWEAVVDPTDGPGTYDLTIVYSNLPDDPPTQTKMVTVVLTGVVFMTVAPRDLSGSGGVGKPAAQGGCNEEWRNAPYTVTINSYTPI